MFNCGVNNKKFKDGEISSAIQIASFLKDWLSKHIQETDKGFIAGLFEGYTGHRFGAHEVDCWASGERICRFKVARK